MLGCRSTANTIARMGPWFFTQVAKTSGTPVQRCLGCSAAAAQQIPLHEWAHGSAVAAQQIPFHEWAHGRCPSPRTAQTWEPEGRPLTGGNEVIGWKNGELLQGARGQHEAARSSEYNEALLGGGPREECGFLWAACTWQPVRRD